MSEWEAKTPGHILEAVRALRGLYERSAEESWELTSTHCRWKLRPDCSVEGINAYQRALQHSKKVVRPHAVVQFTEMAEVGTAPAIFKAHFDLYSALLTARTEMVFVQLLQIALANRLKDPLDWTQAQVVSLVAAAARQTVSWVKAACDIQPLTCDVDELVWWREWRAPMFLRMRPCRVFPYDEFKAWNRLEEMDTIKVLETFEDGLQRTLSGVLYEKVDEARVWRAIQGLDTPPNAEKELPVGPGGFEPSEDYRSIAFRGKTYVVTPKQAKMIEVLHRANNRNAEVSKADLLAAVESEMSEVRSLFRNSPLWQTLVVSGSAKGMYRLNI